MHIYSIDLVQVLNQDRLRSAEHARLVNLACRPRSAILPGWLTGCRPERSPRRRRWVGASLLGALSFR